MNRTANRLTDRTLRSLKPDVRPFDLADGGDLYVRVETSGSVVFWLRYQLNGKRKRWVLGRYGTTGLSLSEARVARDEAKRLLAQGIDPWERKKAEEAARLRTEQAQAKADVEQARKAGRSVAWLCSEFVRLELPVIHRRPQWGAALIRKHVEARIGAVPLDDLKPAHIWETLDPLRIAGQHATARHVYGMLQKVVAFGIARGYLERDPAAGIPRKAVAPKPAAVQRVLSDDEIIALWHDFEQGKVSRVVTLALKTLLLTGQRRGELLRARWSDVDFDGCTWTIPPEHQGKKKNRDRVAPHVVPLAPLAVTVLQELRTNAGSSPWVLPSPEDGARPIDERVLNRAVTRKGAGWSPHDLRRTARTRMAALGVPPHVAEHILGHEQPDLVKTYDRHDYGAEMRDALNRWAAEVERIVQR